MFLLVTITFIVIILVSLLPVGFGVSFTFRDGQGQLRILVVLAHRLHWRVIVPTKMLHIGKRGIQAKARTGLNNPRGGVPLRETITPEKMAEEPKIPESQLHMLLTGVDLLQVLFFGKSPSDGKDRSLGSPLLHLIGGPIVAFARHVCKVDFSWQTCLGTGNAVSTALGVGALWTVKSGLGALLEKRFRVLHLPEINVIPEFEKVAFTTDVRCIFHLSIGEIMWRAVRDAAQRWQEKGAGTFGG